MAMMRQRPNGRPGARLAALLPWSVGLLFLGACAEDTILPVPGGGSCGDGEVTATETCDNDSDGCVDCQVQQGWDCPDNVCSNICGDGIVVGDEECDDASDPTCDSSCKTGERPAQDCNMAGWWIIRQTDFSIDTVLSELQTSSNWFLNEFEQSGDDVTTKTSIGCGIRVSGSVDVNLSEGGLEQVLYANPLDDHPTQGTRRGVSRQNGDECEFSYERWYNVRGLEESFLPTDFRTNPEISSLPPIPTEDDPENPGPPPDGTIDWDGDGQPGLLWVITGNARGQRNTIQRDWNEYLPDSEGEFVVPAGALEFTSLSAFDNEENILVLENCPPIGCGVVGAGSAPSQTARSRVTFRYLGQSLDDPRVAAIVKGPPKASVADDMETCLNVRRALVHKDARDLGVSQ